MDDPTTTSLKGLRVDDDDELVLVGPHPTSDEVGLEVVEQLQAAPPILAAGELEKR